VNPKPLADRLANRRARIKARERILEDDLRLAAIRLQLRPAQLRDVNALKEDGTSGRFNQPQDKTANRCLPATRLANKSERLASTHLKVHAVNSVNLTYDALQCTRAHREGFGKTAHLKERSAARVGALRDA